MYSNNLKDLNNYPNLKKIYNEIILLNKFQEKRINFIFKKANEEYFQFCEEIAKLVIAITKKWNQDFNFISKSYNHLCTSTIKEQLYFKKYGEYSAIKNRRNTLEIYSSDKKMKILLIGLLMSQIFWKNHYKIIKWFENKIKNITCEQFIEIGAGHGYFTKLFLKYNNPSRTVICDISKTSLEMTKSIISETSNISNITFINKNFLELDVNNKYDFLIMGEVLEHVYDPVKFIKCARDYINSNGKIFISTCANCAQEDHLYRFNNINEIKNMILANNLIIEDDLICSSEDIDKDSWEKEKIAVNYCAILKK